MAQIYDLIVHSRSLVLRQTGVSCDHFAKFYSSFVCPKAKGHHEQDVSTSSTPTSFGNRPLSLSKWHVVFRAVRGQPTHEGFHGKLFLNKAAGFKAREPGKTASRR